MHRVIKFNQKAWLKPSVAMTTVIRKNTKNDFEKYSFKLINSAVFGKTKGNVRKHGDIKPVITEARRNYLVSEPNYDTVFFRKFSSHRNEKYTNTYE